MIFLFNRDYRDPRSVLNRRGESKNFGRNVRLVILSSHICRPDLHAVTSLVIWTGILGPRKALVRFNGRERAGKCVCFGYWISR